MPEGLGGATNRPARNPSVMTSQADDDCFELALFAFALDDEAPRDVSAPMTPPHSSEILKRR